MLTQPADSVLAFERRLADGADRVIVLANREDQAARADVALPADWPAGALRDRLGGTATEPAEGRLKLELAPKSVRILVPANR
jgi:hypothetical protein